MPRRAATLLLCLLLTGCRREAPPQANTAPQSTSTARSLLLVTIDTLRADRVGAYGYAKANTPAFDSLAREGVRFSKAYATAPITLPSHASIMSGRYPAGHGARHNGMHIDASTPTLADTLQRAGFATGAFIAAFPLDGRFGLNKGFGTYGDRMPRGTGGRPANERPGQQVVDEALAWLAKNRGSRFFLWVHLFEPHAPYGDRSDARPVADRYDSDVAEADRQLGRLLAALGADRATTLIAVAADHGEAFGEHGEIAHSIFVYDTTLHVPLVMAGPSIAPRTIDDPVALVDLAPTLLARLGITRFDADGIDLSRALAGQPLPARDLYAESFAPFLDFGWSPLRAIRSGDYKYIAAPRPELYDLAHDAMETSNLVQGEARRAAELAQRLDRISPPTSNAARPSDPEAAARLQALGYASGTSSQANGTRPDPKDRRELAGLIAQVTSGELTGAPLRTALERIVSEDPRNPQAQVRLGYLELESSRCDRAVPHFRAAIAGHLPGADALLGLASCQASARQFDAAAATLRTADTAEPGNAVVVANLGIVLSDGGHPDQAIAPLQRALTLDPDFHEARFNLAVALLRAGRRAEAATTAADLLQRLPAGAPQRGEVQRLLDASR